MCGGARSTLGRAPRRGGGRWGSPARRFRLSQPERSERGRELAALLGQSGTLALAGVQGLLKMAARHAAWLFRRIRFRLDLEFRPAVSTPTASSRFDGQIRATTRAADTSSRRFRRWETDVCESHVVDSHTFVRPRGIPSASPQKS